MKKGFTLVELAMVLLIIGVLVGGILVGRSLQDTAGGQRLIRDLQQYNIAATKFQEAYQYVPGDSADFIPPGNYDNLIGNSGGAGSCHTAPYGVYTNAEGQYFFAHLSQAEMLDKTYDTYSPVVCGGAHDDSIVKIPGVVMPYTELTDQAAKWLGYLKYPFSVTTPVSAQVQMTFYTKPSHVLAMEAKLGSLIVNASGAGQCRNSSGSLVACTNSAAAYGQMNWTVKK